MLSLEQRPFFNPVLDRFLSQNLMKNFLNCVSRMGVQKLKLRYRVELCTENGE
jgi:hypothetical protein